MWDLIVSVPDHCLSFYFVTLKPMNQCICLHMFYELFARPCKVNLSCASASHIVPTDHHRTLGTRD